jgi:hypothetical protein
MYKRKDPLTNEEFVTNKSNKFFINHKNQVKFNNDLGNERRKTKGAVQKPLDKNWTILHKILGNNSEIEKSRDYLFGAGFNFTFFTHSRYLSEKQKIAIPVIYDICYYKLENGNYKIFKDGK